MRQNRRFCSAIFMLLVTILITGCAKQDSSRMVGQLESERIEVAFEVTEKVIEHGPPESSSVARGDVLVRQDSTMIDARIAAANSRVAERQAALDKLMNGTRPEQLRAASARLTGTKDDETFRRAEFKRLGKLAADALVSDERLDQAQAALDNAVAVRSTRQAEFDELNSGARAEERAEALAALGSAQADLNILHVERDRHVIRAPQSGLIEQYLFEVGERPVAGQTALVLLVGAQPYARIYVPAEFRLTILPGQSVDIFIDGETDSRTGTIRYISAEAAFTPYFALTEHDRSRLSYLAEVDLEPSGQRLPDGVPVEVALRNKP